MFQGYGNVTLKTNGLKWPSDNVADLEHVSCSRKSKLSKYFIYLGEDFIPGYLDSDVTLVLSCLNLCIFFIWWQNSGK